jgi:putative hemolysin
MLTVLWCFIIGICFVGVLLLSLAEASLLSVSKSKMRALSRRGDRPAGQIVELTDTADFLSAFIVGVNALLLVIATLMTVVVRSVYGEEAQWQQTVAMAAMLAALLVIAELCPKTYGSLRAEPAARAVAGLMTWLTWALTPVVRLMTAISNTVLRLVGISPRHQRHFITADEIRAAADLGEEEGTVEPGEGEMFDSVIELGEQTVKDIMVPRVDIVAVAEDASLEQVADVAVGSGFSRIPVYAETIDRVTGVVYVNDVMAHLGRGHNEVQLSEVAREPLLAPETKRLDEMLRELRESKVHIAIIIDEFGGTEGLVTIEDILEELVGEIEDEHDPLEKDFVLVGDGEALVSGKSRIEEINEALELQLATEEHETISGFLSGKAGRMPQEGEVLREGGIRFVVEQSNEQHVDRVRIILPERQEADD